MKIHPYIYWSAVGFLVLGGIGWGYTKLSPEKPSVRLTEATPAAGVSPTATYLPVTSAPQSDVLLEPIAEFKSRITKKFFGTYVNPSNSPVSPERFTGYHTAVDVEYTDVTSEVPVTAATSGKVVYSGWVAGYGGVVIQNAQYRGRDLYLLYGHLQVSSMARLGVQVAAGDILGVLGGAYSHDTDNERRHLHFSVYPGRTYSLRGYVSQKSQLSDWIDPLSLY